MKLLAVYPVVWTLELIVVSVHSNERVNFFKGKSVFARHNKKMGKKTISFVVAAALTVLIYLHSWLCCKVVVE